MLRLSEKQRNKYQALWEFSHGQPLVGSTPPFLQLSRSNHCNFECVYCGDHRPGTTVPKTQLGGTTWDSLLHLIPRSDVLAFHGISEFMVDPQFFDIVRRCAEAGATLSLNTNGSVCTPKHIGALASYPGHLSINFSLDAASPETFRRVRGWHFDRVVRNIRTYVTRFADRRARSSITLSFVIMKSNVREMAAFVHLAKGLDVDGVRFYRLHEYDGLDWVCADNDGAPFNYTAECAGQFPEEFNRGLASAADAGKLLNLRVELPASLEMKQ